MPLQSPAANAKHMSELSMLTILIQAAAAIKNRDGDTSLHGYVESHGLTSRRVMQPDKVEVDFAVLDSIGDTLLQNHQVLAISPNKREQESGFIITVLMSESKADSDMELPAEHPISEALQVSSISPTVVPNPNDRGRAGSREGDQSGGPLGNLRSVTDGKSMWDIVKGDPLYFAANMDVSTPKGLADHAETLSDYLHEYGEHPSQQSELSEKFFKYLLSACWEKLHRRFCSWQGLGLIRSFEERVDLLNGHLNIIGTSSGPSKEFMVRGPGDRTLTAFLYQNRKFVFQTMLPSVLPSGILPQPVFDGLHKAVVNAFTKHDLTYLYTEETALDFHYFVYCVFVLAGRAIRNIKDHQLPLKQAGVKNKASYASSVEAFKARIGAAVLPVKLLQCVLSSTVFKRHIGVWTNDGECLGDILPKWPQKKDNVEFGKKRQILAGSKKGPSEQSPTDGGGANDDTLKESPAEDGDDGDDDNAPETSGVSGLLMFFRWVRTFVAQFLGKRNLEVYTARLASVSLNKRSEIRVFAVNSERYQVPAWERFEKVIQDALGDTSEEDTAEIIRNFQEKVITGKGLKPEAQRSLGFFRQIVKQELQTCVMYMHCEAVVAALLESRRARSQLTVFSNDPKSNILAELSENLASNMVSISKLCCPVCWELFQVLGMEDVIRGCHPTVTPIVLPETLPSHVSEKLVTRFRAHLSQQLRHLSLPSMFPRPTTGHHRNSSDSGYSAVSSNESASACPQACQDWFSYCEEVMDL